MNNNISLRERFFSRLSDHLNKIHPDKANETYITTENLFTPV